MLRLPFSSQRSSHRYEPLPNSSADDVEHGNVTQPPKSVLQSSWIYKRISPRRRLRSVLRLTAWLLALALLAIVLTVVCESTFSPSYTNPPSHYTELRLRAKGSTTPGRANPHSEKVFIAASLLEKEGHLTSGPWGEAVLQLVDLLGPDNVHLSIYENDVDNGTSHSLSNFRSKAKCNQTILSEPLDLSPIPRVAVPTGEHRLKRVAFLAEMRNRALAPLDSNRVRFDRLLYLNDVIFDPIEAAQLLFATNIDGKGRADYAAACAVDFGNAFKFYDRFATRDLEGQITGLPFFPWFTDTGAAASRKAVMEGTDAVPVSSCWGGMTAFDAKWFQDMPEGAGMAPSNSTHKEPASPLNLSAPVRFRAETDTFWESSECCLIHADIQYRRSGQNLPTDSGIYMNPFIRVAYDQRSLSWLSLTRRPERLYGPIHSILNYFVGFPERQYRNHDQPGQLATQNIWVNNQPPPGGHFEDITRIAQPGGYCSTPNLLLAMNETPEQGSGAWSKIEPWDYQI